MNHINRVRLLFYSSLIFSFWIISCRDKTDNEIILEWENKRPTKIFIPQKLLDEPPKQWAITDHLRVTLAKPGSPQIIGTYSLRDEYVVFEPAIPFTRGLTYEVVYKDKKLKEILIPAPEGTKAPAVTGIYPNSDSLPENLLKIYVSFSEQMQEGVSAQHIFLIKDGVDTLSNVFLDLQPELWNYDRTVLALWLNPGRIKRDLIPNREEGAPLISGSRYELFIKPGWRDAVGDSISTVFQKSFLTVSRDTVSPDTDNWRLKVPNAGSLEPITLSFPEPLDYQVIKNAITVWDVDNIEQLGKVEVLDNERAWRFIPLTEWKKGSYVLRIHPRIEDLAGNNLDRLFDRDLTKPGAKLTEDGETVRLRWIQVEIR
jgi:hypothetical protein